jgi:hypothetical protein
MRRLNQTGLMVLAGLVVTLAFGEMSPVHSTELGSFAPSRTAHLPIFIDHKGEALELERPAVAFDHDRHTTALKQSKSQDCTVCHVLKETDRRLVSPEVKVFRFPKGIVDETDKTSIMYAYHNECVSCHRNKASEGAKTGPDIGLCGSCHKRKPQVQKVTWSWSPLFNYARHARHLEAAKKFSSSDQLNVAEKVDILGETTGNKCELCHHTYDEKQKKLVYKKDTENSCRACHKAKDEQNARSMKKAAHSACIGCHMKLAEKVITELAKQGRSVLTAEDKKLFGPFECQGCHGEHKELAPDEINKIPRLVRGQKDMVDLSPAALKEGDLKTEKAVFSVNAAPVRMKAVPFNHKAHEPRAQFCNTCHHHSLEKCQNCHTASGDLKKGGGVSYERAYHRPDSKQACVGCHTTAKQNSKCAGCHQWMTNGMPSSSCSVCHRGPSGGHVLEVPAAPLFQDKEKVPEKLQIKLLEKEFKPAEIPHMKIVNKLVTISNESSLARWFHAAKEQALCAGCHHRGELQQAAVRAPKCSTCHNRSFDPVALGKPGIMGAYHRQCIGCHETMKQKPGALECVKCHPAKEGVQTAGLIPALSGTK